MNSNLLTRVIEAVVLIIASGSFIISYNNLHESALQMGIPPLYAIIFPITIDAFILVCTLYVLYAGQKCISAFEGWAFLVIYTVASIAFNIHMAPPDWWSRAGFAMCPIGLCIALHFLMKILETEMGGCPVAPAPEVKEESPIEDLIRLNDDTPVSFDMTQDYPMEPVKEVIVESVEVIEGLTENQMKVLTVLKDNSDITMAEAGRRAGLSYKTVAKAKVKLEEMGML